ncbi:MAG TPA: DUF4433 domain-containing protein [Spirochaetota bacterium]|nr:DUF4433 domain-containing protein [Spirochaetota bacterium]HPR48830.1 DUF4433 domain-containing protein [Spirochaetota bacterium]
MVPERPKIYHITHFENLRSIFERGSILSDAECCDQNLDHTRVGMSEIKRRRLEEIRVSCHNNTFVGEYVPFYFCPRSIMLYILYKGNHPDIAYHGGQQPVVHIEADLNNVVQWADRNRILWAFTDRNAGTYYGEFFNDLNDLDHVDWHAINSTDFRNPGIKDGKQAEFLIQRAFPVALIDRIGVMDIRKKKEVDILLKSSSIGLQVEVKPDWYY